MLLLKKISKKEYLFILLLSLILIIITSAPFLYGYFTAPPDKYFLGLHSLSPGDYPVYYSWMMPAYQQRFFIKDLYTQEAAAYNIINTFWFFSGLLGKILNISPRVAFQLSRILSIPVLLTSLYLLISHYFKSYKKRLAALLFLTFSTGISGFITAPLYNQSYLISGYYHLPLDLWVSESNIFLTLLHSGHMALSLSLMILIFYFSLLFIKNYNFKYSLIAGILNLILLSFHPYPIPVIFGVLGVFWLVVSSKNKKINFKLLAHLLIIFFITLPLLIYYFLMLNFDFVTAGRALQNICLTPAFYFLFLSFGFILLFGLVGLTQFFKNKNYQDDNHLFLFIWLIVQSILIYSPFSFQRRLTAGLQLPLTFFALFALFYFYNFLKKKLSASTFNIFVNNKILWFFLFIPLFFFSNLYTLAVDFSYVYLKDSSNYYPSSEIAAMRWLKNNLKENVLILARPAYSAHILPGLAGKNVYAGHQVETVNYQEKKLAAEWFYKTNDFDAQKIDFLTQNKISHIYYGQPEQKLGDFIPDEKKYLKKIYENSDVAVYEVMIN